MGASQLDRSVQEGLTAAQRMIDDAHTPEYLDLDLEARAKVNEVVGHVMAKIHSLMEGHSPFKMALRAALKPRYREFIQRVVVARITEREMTVVLAEVWKQTRAILDQNL